MRKTIDSQLLFGMVEISKIKFNVKSRDDIPQILMGLQYIYTQQDVRKKIFKILEEKTSPNVDKTNGRPGMDLWKILVMGNLRLNLNCDYDRLLELVDNHKTIREMLGHSLLDAKSCYHLQTLKDNVKLLTPEILCEINKVVVDSGHNLVKKTDKTDLKGRCDSFVVETNVHFPTDVNLLFDATRKVIELTARLCDAFSVKGWRQSTHNIKKMKKQAFKLQKLKHSSSKDPIKALCKEGQIKDAYASYAQMAETFIEKAKISEKELLALGVDPLLFEKITYFANHATKQIELIKRRVIQGEKIPHEEKTFSLFEPHTEWVCKGKAGVPVELGLKVSILEDQFGFILGHKIMQNQTDDKIAVPIVKEAKNNFPGLNSCSFDKGYHSLSNQKELKEILDTVTLPKKGKISKKDDEYQPHFPEKL